MRSSSFPSPFISSLSLLQLLSHQSPWHDRAFMLHASCHVGLMSYVLMGLGSDPIGAMGG